MVKQIIRADAYQTRKEFKKEGADFLRISEFFYDTIQGEGINAGHPAAFLRLQNCHLGCTFCDSSEVWRYGSPYSFGELFALIEGSTLIDQLRLGQHLVITGGSPLLQQSALANFLDKFSHIYNIFPFIEIENECTIMPNDIIHLFVGCWNNSPKLKSSGVKDSIRYKPEVLRKVASFHNSWFKFVITCSDDWNEIYSMFLLPKIIRHDQIILMPEGATRDELASKREMVVELAVQHGVRYSDRVHVVVWNRKTGV
jgi:7-carboxy-7-deazaguanine synthase